VAREGVHVQAGDPLGDVGRDDRLVGDGRAEVEDVAAGLDRVRGVDRDRRWRGAATGGLGSVLVAGELAESPGSGSRSGDRSRPRPGASGRMAVPLALGDAPTLASRPG
jgi:hypothetical protein